ncbi:MAG: glycosyltransferase, partial [Lentisphaerota bacterium]
AATLPSNGTSVTSLAEIYAQADLITYPSLYEGFGNAFLEAIYFRIPVVVNRYEIFGRDIEPKGFRVPIMEGYITQAVIDEVRRVLEDSAYRTAMVNHNYEVASRFYDYTELRRNLRTLLTNITGISEVRT